MCDARRKVGQADVEGEWCDDSLRVAHGAAGEATAWVDSRVGEDACCESEPALHADRGVVTFCVDDIEGEVRAGLFELGEPFGVGEDVVDSVVGEVELLPYVGPGRKGEEFWSVHSEGGELEVERYFNFRARGRDEGYAAVVVELECGVEVFEDEGGHFGACVHDDGARLRGEEGGDIVNRICVVVVSYDSGEGVVILIEQFWDGVATDEESRLGCEVCFGERVEERGFVGIAKNNNVSFHWLK